MPIKISGSLTNADNFVILHENHKEYVNKYYSNNSYKPFTDFFKDVTTFAFNGRGINYFEEQNLPSNYTIMFVPYFDYNRIGDKIRTIQNTYAKYSSEEIEIENPIEFLRHGLRYGLVDASNSYKKDKELTDVMDNFNEYFEIKNTIEPDITDNLALIEDITPEILPEIDLAQISNDLTKDDPLEIEIDQILLETSNEKVLYDDQLESLKQECESLKKEVDKLKSEEYIKELINSRNLKTENEVDKLIYEEIKKRVILEVEKQSLTLKLKEEQNLNNSLKLEIKEHEDLKENHEKLKNKIEELAHDLSLSLPIFENKYEKETFTLNYEETKTEEIYDLNETLYNMLINSIGTNLINIKFEKTVFKNKNVTKAAQYKINVNSLPTNKIVKLYEYLDNLLYRYYNDLPDYYLQKDILISKEQHIKLTHSPGIYLQLTDTNINIIIGWFENKPLIENLKDSPYSQLNCNHNYILSDIYNIQHDIKKWRAEYYNREYFNRFYHEKIEFEGDFIKENSCMIYISNFDENNIIKIGRSENWPHRKSQYYYDSEIEYEMLLAWYMYVPEHEDVEITKYIMYCMEDELKRIANKHFEPHKGKEYFVGTSKEDTDNFIKEVNNKLKKLTIKEILNFRPESKILQYASNKNRNYDKVVEILTNLRNN